MQFAQTNCLANMTTHILGYVAQLSSSTVSQSDIDWKQWFQEELTHRKGALRNVGEETTFESLCRAPNQNEWNLCLQSSLQTSPLELKLKLLNSNWLMALIEYLPEPIVFSTMNVQKLLIMLFQILNCPPPPQISGFTFTKIKSGSQICPVVDLPLKSGILIYM